MKRFVTIDNILEPRSYARRDGSQGVMTDIVVSWQERDSQGQTYKQGMVVTLNGFVNEPMVNTAIAQNKEFELTYYTEPRMHNGRWFNSIRGFINRDFMSNVNMHPIG